MIIVGSILVFSCYGDCSLIVGFCLFQCPLIGDFYSSVSVNERVFSMRINHLPFNNDDFLNISRRRNNM